MIYSGFFESGLNSFSFVFSEKYVVSSCPQKCGLIYFIVFLVFLRKKMWVE